MRTRALIRVGLAVSVMGAGCATEAARPNSHARRRQPQGRKQFVETVDAAAADERDRPAQHVADLCEQRLQLRVRGRALRGVRQFDEGAVDVEKQAPGDRRLRRCLHRGSKVS